jgi:motility quorum-sensing regulator/GCU-specific mRNA interferase toxin
LAAFKAAMADRSKRNITGSALKDAAALGFDSDDIAATVQTMEAKQFYKSMTSHYDHKVWHDVYHVPSKGMVLYVKFTSDTITEFFTLLSFKEK